MSIKEENLIQYNGTLKVGQRLTKVGNTFIPVGVGGAFEPGSGGGGPAKYYQCATVDTTAKTWSGKELVLTNGVYVVSDTETTGLVYGSGFTPIVGKVYSEDGLLELKDYYQGFLLVSPTDMTSYENDEWVISASSVYYDDTYAPYNAFSGSDTETYGWISSDRRSFPNYIQWQHKTKKSKVLKYAMQVNGWTDIKNRERFPGSWELQGSHDGSNWVIVDDRTDEITDYTQLETHKYYEFECQNPEYFQYYRIYVKAAADSSESIFTYIGQIKAYGTFE